MNLPFFVYGTLRSEFGNHRCFGASVRQIDKGTLVGASMRASGIPFVYRTTVGNVIGEVITVDPDLYAQTMRSLDSLEGYRGPGQNNLYNREIVEVVLADGSTVDAYAYLVDANWAQSNAGEVVTSGDYADHRNGYRLERA